MSAQIPSIDAELARLAELDRDIAAFVEENGRPERLRREVGELMRRWDGEAVYHSLYATWVGVKDIFHVEGVPTRGGAVLPDGVLDGEEAACVRLLKDAGALILGKTATTEFAYFEPASTRNPRNRAHTPGGSSSGSAAAVAAGICPLAVGSQTVGSVIRPAAFCGVLGFKPSYDRIPSAGMLYYSPAVDTVGIFADSLDRMEKAAAVLCVDWQRDVRVKKPVLGVPDGPYMAQASEAALALFDKQLMALERAGWSVQRVPLLTDIKSINARHTRLISGEAARVHAQRFAQYGHLYRPRTAALVREGAAIDATALDAARAGCLRLREEIEETMDRVGIDLWLSPAATGPAPLGLASTGDPVMNLPWTHAGLPALSLPAGRAENGLPVALQCTARFGMDEALLSWVRPLEKVFQL